MSLHFHDLRHEAVSPVGVIDIIVAGKATEHRLPQHTDQRVATISALPNGGGGEREGVLVSIGERNRLPYAGVGKR